MTYLMVAPNGARKTKTDHPALPVTSPELVQTALACWQAGAQGLHAHIRNEDQSHLLDVGRYRELFALLKETVPELEIQVTTEAAGVYQAAEQRQLVLDLGPDWISLSVREMAREPDAKAMWGFYTELAQREIRTQHILYDTKDLRQLFDWIDRGALLRPASLSILWVLGRYSTDGSSDPAELNQVNNALQVLGTDIPEQVMVCAFGLGQISCLVEAAKRGWDCRVGFENGWWKQDGSIAKDNADQLRDLRYQLSQQKRIV
jgi:uncharacterized protein (DUF849 family)